MLGCLDSRVDCDDRVLRLFCLRPDMVTPTQRGLRVCVIMLEILVSEHDHTQKQRDVFCSSFRPTSFQDCFIKWLDA